MLRCGRGSATLGACCQLLDPTDLRLHLAPAALQGTVLSPSHVQDISTLALPPLNGVVVGGAFRSSNRKISGTGSEIRGWSFRITACW